MISAAKELPTDQVALVPFSFVPSVHVPIQLIRSPNLLLSFSSTFPRAE